DDDQTPAIGPSGPTPTVEVTETPAAVVPAPTEPATATTEPAATATATAEPSPTPSLPSFGTIAATIPVGAGVRNMAAGEGALWVTNASDGTVSRIDLATNEVVATIEVAPPGDQSVDAIAVGGGAVWVTTQGSIQLARIDPATNQVVTTISLNTAVHELVFGGGALWGRGSFSNTIVRVDPATNTVVASIDVPPPTAIVYLDDALWVMDVSDVSKIDPATNSIVATVHYNDDPSGPTGTGIVAAGGSLWLSDDSLGPELVQIDPASATILARVALPVEVDRIATAGSADAVYICGCTGSPDTMIWQFDVATHELTAALNVPDAEWLISDADSLWTYNGPLQEVTRVDVTS
ncbi:MAG TPA: hypothetical protein VFV93_18775, partial [Thermomicrobiales bacterium]|nr:hypothetical protein [Thermomicrobiales bacterium]